jgi:predicted nucleic acid-binding protein
MELAPGELLFLDASVLLAATDESRPHHGTALRSIAVHRSMGLHFAVSGQILREYLVVATRAPEANGLGLHPASALGNIEALRQRLVFLEETEQVSERLLLLVKKYALSGTRIHDANVVAAMLAHGLEKIVTENQRDFSIFSEIETAGLVELGQLVEEAP